jgi:oxygen-dependent protoporphyrinogen oxidase
MRRIAIIGGGITGLAAAYEALRAGLRPVLIEKERELGGVIRTESREGCTLEGGPDSFLSAKPAALELIREVGLGSDVIGSNDESRVTYLVKHGRLVPLPDGLMMMVPTRIMPVALSPLLGWGTKIRMGLEYFRRPGGDPQDRTVEEFVREHYGQETVDYLAEPLLAGVYGGSVRELSVRSVLPRFVELESEYGSLTRGVLAARAKAPKGKSAPLFQTLKGGLGQLTRELERRIRPGTQVVTGEAEAVERAGEGWRVRVGGEWLETDGAILACPAWAAAEVLEAAAPAVSRLLAPVAYSSSITLSLVYRREDCGRIPPGFGFLVPAKERGMLVACTFTGAKFSHRVPERLVVLRCFLGGSGGEHVLEYPDGEIIATARRELRALLGWDTEPAFHVMHRWRRAMAQYGVGHWARINELTAEVARLPGLELAGNGYDGIGIPDCIRMGRAAAKRLAASSAQR